MLSAIKKKEGKNVKKKKAVDLNYALVARRDPTLQKNAVPEYRGLDDQMSSEKRKFLVSVGWKIWNLIHIRRETLEHAY